MTNGQVCTQLREQVEKDGKFSGDANLIIGPGEPRLWLEAQWGSVWGTQCLTCGVDAKSINCIAADPR